MTVSSIFIVTSDVMAVKITILVEHALNHHPLFDAKRTEQSDDQVSKSRSFALNFIPVEK